MSSQWFSKKLTERCRRAAVLILALFAVGALYTVFAPSSAAEEKQEPNIAVREGQRLFNQSCNSCHGTNAEGVPGRGPSLIGVGASSVDFQVSSGRMPMARQEAQAMRKPAHFNATETAQLAAYVESLGGGPKIPTGKLRGDIALGGNLFRLNCAQCHGFSAMGGALSSGKFAPTLEKSTDRQIYAAMQTGPQNMPVFGDNQLKPEEKKAIIAYVQSMKDDQDPGGLGIGRTGPVPEGLVVFLVGITALLFATLWIAGKSKS